MRLIDADKSILHLNDFMLQQSPIDVQDIESIKVSAVIKDCIKAVDEQPTAYDVDKVVEELDAYITKLVGKNSALYQTIIGIVKAGGIEMCIRDRSELTAPY